MLQNNTQFFKPSQLFRNLSILEAVSRDSGVTQKTLARETYMSEAMVNQYIRDLQTQGILELKSVNKKQFLYSLTRQGQELRLNLQDRYCSEMVQFLNKLKQRIRDSLSELIQKKSCPVALLGATEECELVLQILRQDTNATIVALADPNPEKQGQKLQGQVIISPEKLSSVHFDYLVLASFNRQDLTRSITEHVPGNKEFEILKI